jgi:hypothetical protein
VHVLLDVLSVLCDVASDINKRTLSTDINQFLTETVHCMVDDAKEQHTHYTHYTLTRKLHDFAKHTPHTRYDN